MSDTIVVVGDSMLDRYYEGPIDRVSPEAPVPIIGVDTVYDVAGGAANVAKNIAALGNKVHLVTLLGGSEDDDAAMSLQERLEQEPYVVQLHAYFDKSFRTPIKNRIVDSKARQIARFDIEQYNRAPDKKIQQLLVDEVIALLNQKKGNGPVRCLVLSDYRKGVLMSDVAVLEILGEAQRLKIPTIIDPKHHNIERYAPATIITPNLSEAQQMVEIDDDSAVNCAEELILQLAESGVTGVYVKDGEEGGWLATLRKDGTARLSLIPPYPAHEVFDATGAGDVVIAVLAHELKCTPEEYADVKYDLDDACRRANMAAGFVVTKAGTSFIDAVHYDQTLSDNGRVPPLKVCDLDALQVIVENGKDAGEKIVFTNGCFDILHPGHLKLLQTARSLGDFLIVAVNSDASVQRLKGKSRPLISEVHRARMLEGFECVDAVIVFDDDTPEKIIKAITPDVLVKGSDWKDDMKKIAGSDHVLDNGGSVVFVDLLEDFSTTKLIQGR